MNRIALFIANLLIGVLSVCVSSCLLIAQEKDPKVELERFNINSGMASMLETRAAQEFIELVDSQKGEIEAIKDRIKDEAEAILADDLESPNTKLTSLKKLKERQERELRKVLLPEQATRFDGMPIYSGIAQEGLAYSMANGFIASYLELSNDERAQVQSAAIESLKQYQADMEAAQKKALRRLQASLPSSKSKKYNELIEPLLFANGTFWKVPRSDMLNPKKPIRYSHSRLPPIK